MAAAHEPAETDLLYGVEHIADHLKMTPRQVYHLHDQGHLPTFKIGGKVCARRSTLAKHFAAQEAAPACSHPGSRGPPGGPTPSRRRHAMRPAVARPLTTG